MPQPTYPALGALTELVDGLNVGPARRRQLGMVRGELERALQRDALTVAAPCSLRQLFGEEAVASYVRLAESGALRARQVAGGYPPTSEPTNRVRYACVDLLRQAVGLPALQLGGGAVELRSIPDAAVLAALSQRLGEYVSGAMSPGQIRLTALLALVLDTAARSGELTAQRITDLSDDLAAVCVRRGAQHGEWVRTSALTRAALGRWLPCRAELVARAHGTHRLWVSLRFNHDGHGRTVLRPPGLPLEENGLITSYRVGRARYDGLRALLPPKVEQLRRAVESAS